MAFDHGGGSFLIPYLAVTLFIGFPFLVYEFSIGRRYGGSIVHAIDTRLQKRSWLGWAIGLNCFVIVGYYAVILAWCVNYLISAIGLTWGNDTAGYFVNEILGRTESVWQIGMPKLALVFALLFVWIAVFWITSGTVKRLEKVLRFTVLLPLVVLLILLFRAVTLPGAAEGLAKFFQPKVDTLFNVETWAAAVSQVMLSLSIGMGQIVAYSSRGKASTVWKSGFATAFANAGFSIFAGITVFATMGYFIQQSGSGWQSLSGGPGLAFVAYPAVIGMLPWGASSFGVLFFSMLILLGIDSAFAVIEANLLPIEEKSGLLRQKISGLLCVVGLFLGLFFTTGAGIYWLDIVDHMVAYYGILIAVVIESLLLGFKSKIFKPEVQKGNFMHNVVKTWQFVIRFVTPLAITSIIMSSLWNDIQNPYGDYPRLALLCGGLVVAASIGLGSFFLSRLYTRKAGKTVGRE